MSKLRIMRNQATRFLSELKEYKIEYFVKYNTELKGYDMYAEVTDFKLVGKDLEDDEMYSVSQSDDLIVINYKTLISSAAITTLRCEGRLIKVGTEIFQVVSRDESDAIERAKKNRRVCENCISHRFSIFIGHKCCIDDKYYKIPIDRTCSEFVKRNKNI